MKEEKSWKKIATIGKIATWILIILALFAFVVFLSISQESELQKQMNFCEEKIEGEFRQGFGHYTECGIKLKDSPVFRYYQIEETKDGEYILVED